MLYAALAQCPVLGGKVGTVDSAAAESMPGVRQVLTTASGVVVVADHFWQALQARNALKITWDPGANAQLDNAAMQARAREGRGGRSRAWWRARTATWRPRSKARSAALDAVYELPLLAHATMEPMNCTADVKAGRCDLYVGTQVQQSAQAAAAAAAGLQPDQVHVVTTLLGGGFGRRLDVDFIPAAVEASKAVGAPVKLIWTREDDMTHDTYRPPIREEVSAGLDARRQAHRVEPAHHQPVDHRAALIPPNKDPFDSVVEYAQNYPYAVPNFALTLFAPGDRHRRRLPALREPRAQLLRDRELHGRAGGSRSQESLGLSPGAARGEAAPRPRAQDGGRARRMGPRAAGPLSRDSR